MVWLLPPSKQTSEIVGYMCFVANHVSVHRELVLAKLVLNSWCIWGMLGFSSLISASPAYLLKCVTLDVRPPDSVDVPSSCFGETLSRARLSALLFLWSLYLAFFLFPTHPPRLSHSPLWIRLSCVVLVCSVAVINPDEQPEEERVYFSLPVPSFFCLAQLPFVSSPDPPD